MNDEELEAMNDEELEAMNDEELEAYLRKRSLLGQMQEVHDQGAALAHLVAQKTGFVWLMDTLSAWLQRLIDKLWKTWRD